MLRCLDPKTGLGPFVQLPDGQRSHAINASIDSTGWQVSVVVAENGENTSETTRALLQLQLHLISRVKSQRVVKRAAGFAGVQEHRSKVLLAAPHDDGLHQPAGDSPAAELRVDIHIENGGPAALEIIGMTEPGADDNGAASCHLFACKRQPAAE